MQLFKIQDNAPAGRRGESARSAPAGLVIEESLQRPLLYAFLTVLLLHGLLIAGLYRPPEPETPAQPLVMDVALVAARPPAKPAPPVPPTPPPAKPKPRPVPAKAKKTAVAKKTPVIPKPAVMPEPTAKPEAVSSPAPVTPPQPAPVSPPAFTQPKAETFTEANYRANYKSNPKPEYPRLARSRGWEGKVLLRVRVTVEGRSADVSVQQSSGHEMLDVAAIEAVRNWTFIPAKRGDTPVASTVTVPMQFKLSE